MSHSPPLIKWILPGLFAAYALMANIQIWRENPPEFAATPSRFITGHTSASIDSYYRENLPHITTSVGLIGALRYQFLNEMRTGGWAGKNHWLFSQEELRQPTNTDSAHRATGHITAMSKQLEKSGIQLILLPIPAKIDIHNTQANLPASSTRLHALHQQFLAKLKAQNIAHIDIGPALHLASKSAAVFFRTDTHWTEHGAAIAAQTVATSGQIPIGLQTYSRQPLPSTPLAGDLISFVTTPRYSKLAGLPTERVTPYLAVEKNSELGNMFAPPAIDLVLVGTSYSANENWSFAEALKLSLHRDVLNVAASGLGPVQPLRRYLDSSNFTETPPKIILWEFPIRYLNDPELWHEKRKADQ